MAILDTLSCTIDESGISTPTYTDILESLTESFQQIYGEDVDVAADTQDGQWIAILAKAIYDTNTMAVATYNSFSPSFAQGAGLSSLIKLNGLKRKSATYSTVVVQLIGNVGLEIQNGAVSDLNGNRWLLPATVTIPVEGFVLVTATAGVEGDITAAPNTVTIIDTPTPGWYSVNNLDSAAIGDPVESDATLRQRQAQSTAFPATSPASAILAAVLNVSGVTRAKLYENNSDLADSNSVPAHSIAVVVEGGDIETVAQVISYKKSPGTGTYGDSSVVVIDPSGIPDTVNLSSLDSRQVYFKITIQPLTGYLSTIGNLLMASIVQYINSLDIGAPVYLNRLLSAANLQGEAATNSSGLTQINLDDLSDTYIVLSLELSFDNINFGENDLYIKFDEAASSTITNGTLTVFS